jgi:hypothetical protein
MRPVQLTSLHATSHAQGKLYIITEYAGNGNLHDYIKKQKQRLPEDMIWKLFAQVPGSRMGAFDAGTALTSPMLADPTGPQPHALAQDPAP